MPSGLASIDYLFKWRERRYVNDKLNFWNTVVVAVNNRLL